MSSREGGVSKSGDDPISKKVVINDSDYLIPKTAFKLECHLNWLQPISETMGKLTEHRRNWLEDTKNDPFTPMSQTLTHHILDALLAYMTEREYQKAKEFLEAGKKLVEEANVPKDTKLTFDYLLLANDAILLFWSGNLEKFDEVKNDVAFLWVKCMESNTATAAFLAMKAFCYGIYKGNCQARLDLYREVVQLDPDVPEYLDSYYKALRKIRREKEFLSSAPEAELELVEKAYALAPESPSILRSMSMIYHDTLKARNHDENFTNRLLESMDMEQFVKKMKHFAREASELNPYSAVNAIRLAEILSYGPDGKKNSCLSDVTEVEAQFLKCVQTWPNNSEVLHKIGKFYCSIDTNTGLDYLKKSIDIDGENYPAMMDYMRTSYRQNKSRLTILIDLLTCKLPNFVHRQGWYTTLLCLKASLLAKRHSFREAVEIWMKAVTLDSSLLKGDHTLLARGTFNGLFQSRDYMLLRDYIEEEITAGNMKSETSKVQLLRDILKTISKQRSFNSVQKVEQIPSEAVDQNNSPDVQGLPGASRPGTTSTDQVKAQSEVVDRQVSPPAYNESSVVQSGGASGSGPTTTEVVEEQDPPPSDEHFDPTWIAQMSLRINDFNNPDNGLWGQKY